MTRLIAVLGLFALPACQGPRAAPEPGPPLTAKPDGKSVGIPESAPSRPPARAAMQPRRMEPWQMLRNPPASLELVTPASERFAAVEWPASINEPTRVLIRAQVGDMQVDGGIKHIRAKRKLAQAGYPALFGIVERLRTLDYRITEQAMFGFELNKLIEEITGGLNARFAPVQADEQIAPAKAEWNTKTVGAWLSIIRKWPDKAGFEKAKSARTRKRNG